MADPGPELLTFDANSNVSSLHQAAFKGADRACAGPMHICPLKTERIARRNHCMEDSGHANGSVFEGSSFVYSLLPSSLPPSLPFSLRPSVPPSLSSFSLQREENR